MSKHRPPCGCCTAAESWGRDGNRPGLTSIGFRLAEHHSFLQRMLTSLHSATVERDDGSVVYPLADLTTRSLDDPAIAVIDAAAVVGDILTFYQERIANEGFLRTATERLSVLELARSIGYELHPGAAASTHLAFVLDATEPHTTVVPAGTRVDSLPEGGALPQTFETKADLPARSIWNAIRPFGAVPQRIAIVNGEVRLFTEGGEFSGPGVATESRESLYSVTNPDPTGTVTTKPLDQLRLAGTGHQIKKGDRILFVGYGDVGPKAVVLRVLAAYEDPAAAITEISFSASPEQTTISLTTAPATPQTPPPSTPPLTASAATTWVGSKTWRDADLRSFLTVAEWDADRLTEHLAAVGAPVDTEERGVYAFRVRSAAFGNNAPLHASLPEVAEESNDSAADNTDATGFNFRGEDDPFSASWDGGWPIFEPYPTGTSWPNGGIRLNRVVDDLAADSWAVIEQRAATGLEVEVRRITEVWEESVTGFSLAGEVTALGLDSSVTGEIDPQVRRASIYAGSVRLPLAPIETDRVLAQSTTAGADQIVLEQLYIGLEGGQPATVRGIDADLEGIDRAEVANVERVEHHFGRTVLFLREELRYRYLTGTVTINGNTVAADHGVTGTEVLGGGDASEAQQRFALARTGPERLTQAAANTPSGVEPELAIAVNGVRWLRVDALFGRSGTEEVYELRIDDDGKALAGFGDGSTGRRIPTGAQNVTATYRVGIGAVGEVGADALTLLPARPEWVAEVSNPLPASGAQDPESLRDARRNAPLAVRTLDRVVSVSDYQDFSRSYAGIGKARADRAWDGTGELIVVTVGSATGAPLTSESPAVAGLVESLETYRDPVRPIRVLPLAQRSFDIAAKVIVDDRFDGDAVCAQIDAGLRRAYSYDERNLAAAVTKSDVIGVMHAVDGVVAVDLDLLATTGLSGTAAFIEALPARLQGTIRPAQLLLLNPVGLTLTPVFAP